MSPDQIATLEKRLVGTSTCNLYVDPEVVRKLVAELRAEQQITAKLKEVIRVVLAAQCDTLQVHVIQEAARRVMAEILGKMAANGKTEEPTQ